MNRKELNQKQYQYILDNIDTDGYDVIATTEKEKIAFLKSTFEKEKRWEIERYGVQKALISWFQGLPSAVHIDFENYRIIEICEDWGLLKKDRTGKTVESAENRIINTWFSAMAMKTMGLFKRLEIKEKPIRTKFVPKHPQRKDKLQKLAESLDFRTKEEYFDYCITSYINGNFSQCKRLFKDLTPKGRKALCIHISEQGSEKEIYNFYFNLL